MFRRDRSDVDAGRFEAAVQALRRKALTKRPLPRLREILSALTLRRRLDTTTLIAGPGLKRIDMVGGWRAHDGEAMWLLPVSTRMRYLELRFVARITSNPVRLRQGKWQIYCDAGKGFIEHGSRIFPYGEDRISVRRVIALHGPAYSIRVDPTDFPCEFIVDQFEIVAMRRILGLPKIIAQRLAWLQERGILGESLRDFLFSLATFRPRRAIWTLFGRNPLQPQLYQQWIEARKITDVRRAKFKSKIETLNRLPLFSIIMPTFNSPPEFLEKAICSVTEQIYPYWELCIADDGSKAEDVRRVLDRHKDDHRIKVTLLEKNRGISAASNAALALAVGDYIALLDHDDEIAPHALYAFASAINEHPDADWLYSDEDKIDEQGRRSGPLFKPKWSPAFFQGCMYTCHLGVYRRELALKLGGFRSEYDMAQDYDLALRFARATTRIVHVPDVLYHWRMLSESTASGAQAKPDAELAARRALQVYLDAGPIRANAEPGPFPGTHRPRYEIVGEPLVSITIPSAGRPCEVSTGRSWLVLELVHSIYGRTEYKNFEVVIAENGDFDSELRDKLDRLGARRVEFRSPPVFNLSEKMNFLVDSARGEYVILLNDDMTIINGGWLTEMLMWCQQSDVAAVGAKLIFPTERIQHAGVLLFGQGPSHIYYGEDNATAVGLAGSAVLAREYSAVTGACLMTRRSDYLAIGGFDPVFRINYNDVDFCVRLAAHTGGRIVYAPYAMLYHHEAVSKDPVAPEELALFNRKWADLIGSDPYYNVHLSQYSSVCALRDYILPIEEQYGLDSGKRDPELAELATADQRS